MYFNYSIFVNLFLFDSFLSLTCTTHSPNFRASSCTPYTSKQVLLPPSGCWQWRCSCGAGAFDGGGSIMQDAQQHGTKRFSAPRAPVTRKLLPLAAADGTRPTSRVWEAEGGRECVCVCVGRWYVHARLPVL